MGYSFYTKLYKKINGIPSRCLCLYEQRRVWRYLYQAANITATGVRGWGSCEENFIYNLHSVVGYSEISLFS